MSKNQPDIPDELAPEILEIASRYYSESQNSYSLAELQDAGAEVQIPPEFIEKALRDVQVKKQQERQQQQQAQERRKTVQWIATGVAVILATATGPRAAQNRAMDCHWRCRYPRYLGHWCL
ncbi:hypothetical protein [Sodalinema gerasimenkoae]|uniref:hypothetical protein n=1 Tax=Sodalinema gerasimenkoae TaxID=2862348 RepID=UPI001FE9198F|nr:hypothetical protein [Sodalinema gerasimenkoae]